jgi:integrase/recombinase XerD
MTNLRNAYTQYLNEKSMSANTKESYLRDLSQFFDFLNENRLDEFTVKSEDIERFVQELEASGKSASSIMRMIASIRSFFKYLVLKGFITENPVKKIKPTKSKKSLPQILSNEEINRLFAQPDLTDTKGIRDKAMLELLYSTGIKVSELIMLNVDDVNLQIGVIYCSGESVNSGRIIPIISPKAIKIISNYISGTRNLLLDDDNQKALFVNMNGNRITRQGFWKIIKSYTKSAGIEKDVTPQILRHSFATHLLENGAKLKDLQELLGHSDISSTQIYSQIIKKKYQDSLTRFHPEVKMKGNM